MSEDKDLDERTAEGAFDYRHLDWSGTVEACIRQDALYRLSLTVDESDPEHLVCGSIEKADCQYRSSDSIRVRKSVYRYCIFQRGRDK